jgi:hypothetical protein
MPRIVNAGRDSMAAVAFHGGAATAESRDKNEAAEEDENVSHMSSFYL